jgi:hypothetical protein
MGSYVDSQQQLRAEIGVDSYFTRRALLVRIFGASGNSGSLRRYECSP